MIVVDTNVIGYTLLASEHSRLAEQALVIDSEWAAPMLWRSEFRNVLAQYLRNDRLEFNDCLRIMDKAAALVGGREFIVQTGRVLELVASSTCSAYDCEFVALAQDLGVPLVTVDRQVLNNFPADAIDLTEFVRK
jgi:predicted nucleic acid-binding protein